MWLKVSHTSANVRMKTSSKERTKLLNSLTAAENRAKHLTSFYFGTFYNCKAVATVDGNTMQWLRGSLAILQPSLSNDH